ncbi:S8 family serine peptidase [Segeticoccus rhizosphaerae]|uniref:S8 family serine peptidase n=1 Tax=Segeticoccus rhizosphaerae TaxID=1104777 RepID=UPI0012657CA0|nr:S8 family serine peptidase [Segeticoccus rhizosphaerae]
MPGEAAGALIGEPIDLRVAVLRHPDGVADEVARAVSQSAQFLAHSRLLVDPGYWLTPAGSAIGGPRPGSWLTEWVERRPELLAAYRVPQLPTSVVGAAGTVAWQDPVRVLVIDTGDERASAQDAFVMSTPMGTADSPPQDWHGHGTSLSDVIRMRAPDARLTSARVFEREDRYSASAALLNALVFAASSVADADLVCIAQRAVISGDASRNLETLRFILTRAQERGFRLPVFVCAAGNTWRGETMALPATLPGVLVARAQEWTGELVEYNCRVPLAGGVSTVDAYGGTHDQPFGTTVCSDGRAIRMYGSSYAAALVTAALAQP